MNVILTPIYHPLSYVRRCKRLYHFSREFFLDPCVTLMCTVSFPSILGFSNYLLLISRIIPLWSENRHCMLFQSFKFVKVLFYGPVFCHWNWPLLIQGVLKSPTEIVVSSISPYSYIIKDFPSYFNTLSLGTYILRILFTPKLQFKTTNTYYLILFESEFSLVAGWLWFSLSWGCSESAKSGLQICFHAHSHGCRQASVPSI